MSRIREGWWPMLVLCVGFGLWFFMMPLLGYGYALDGIELRPGWIALPPCIFGAVFAARNARGGVLGATLVGVALFAVTFELGAQFRVMQLTNAAACTALQRESTCHRATLLAERAEHWDAMSAIGELRSPLEIRTFVEPSR